MYVSKATIAVVKDAFQNGSDRNSTPGCWYALNANITDVCTAPSECAYL